MWAAQLLGAELCILIGLCILKDFVLVIFLQFFIQNQ